MTGCRSALIDIARVDPIDVTQADGSRFSAVEAGSLPVVADPNAPSLVLDKVYHVPKLPITLISASCLDAAGYSIQIRD